MLDWKKLDKLEELEHIKELSKEKPVIIFKHSTSCSISAMALNRLERSWNETEMSSADAYYLDLIANRDVSNAIAAEFGVEHQSPQILVIKNGTCIYDNSHMGISYSDVKEQALA